MGETPVFFNAFLRHGDPPKTVFGTTYVHCADCLTEVLAKFNERFAIVNTVPTCLLDRTTGQLIDFSEESDGR